jgi:4'-phosphopantetheinyl transferase
MTEVLLCRARRGQFPADVLSPAELRRRERHPDPGRFTLGRCLIRTVVGKRLGIAPQDVELDSSCVRCGGDHGKPRTPAAPWLHFSLSHSEDVAMLAVAEYSWVGVDIEAAFPLPADQAASKLLNAAELAEYRRVPPEDRQRVLRSYWTCKEAVLKTTGAGLTVPLTSITVRDVGSVRPVVHWAAYPGITVHVVPNGHVAVLTTREVTVREVSCES